MKNKLIVMLFIILSNIKMFGQNNTTHIPGTPCNNCQWVDPNVNLNQTASRTILDGNGIIATSYTQTACGLNFVQASNPLYKRGFSFQVGLNQPAAFLIAGIPAGAIIQKAFLYLGASGNLGTFTSSITNPLAANANFTMTQIGQHTDKCWGYGGTFNYRADVTSIIAGNGNYSISGIPVMPQVPSKDADGATLFIIYKDPSQNYTGSIVIGDGAQVGVTGTINSVLAGFNVCGSPTLTTNFLLASDLQKVANTDIRLNSLANNFMLPMASQQVWNFVSSPIAPVVIGQTTANFGITNPSDCFNLIMAGMYFQTACSVCGINTVPNQTICAGSGYGFSVPNNSVLTNPSYSINPGGITNTTGNFSVTPIVTTTYTTYVTGLNASNISVTETQTFMVTVNPQPVAAPTTTQSSCTSTVNAFNLGLTFLPTLPVPSYTVNWAPIPAGVSSPTQTSGTGGIAPGLYNATIVAAGGCSTTTSFSISPALAPAVFNLVPGGTSFTVSCTQPTVVINLNPAIYNYTWTNGISAPQTGPTGNFTSLTLGTWSVTGVNPASGCSSIQIFSVTQSFGTPSATLSPLAQNITCAPSSASVVTAIASPTLNITHMWMSPLGGTLTAGTPTAIFLPGSPGTYTHCIVNNLNGCSSCSTFSVFSSSNFPTYTLTSPQQFTIGCGTTSLTTINISNVQTYTAVPGPPTGGPVSYTVLPPSYAGPTYTFSGVSVFTVNTAGQYTVITKDNTNFCETKIQVSIISNTAAPTLTATTLNPTLTCYVPSTILQGLSNTPNVGFSWSFPGVPGQVPNDTLTVYSTTLTTNTVVATYTLSVTDNINKCKSTQTLTVYQNNRNPNAIISGSNAISCSTATLNLTNGSTTNVYPTFFPTLPVIGYLWSGPSPQLPEQLTSTYIAFTPGTYTMVAKDLNNGCYAVATKTIGDNRVYPAVNTPSAPPAFIFDCAAPGATIYPIITGTTSGFTYSWVAVPTTSFSSYTSSVTVVNKPGIYRIYVLNPANGCLSYGNVEVINGGLNGDFSPSVVSGYAPLTVNFTNLSSSSSTATGASSITSVWSFGNGTSQITTATAVSPVTIYQNAGTYTVTMYVNKGSCKDTVVKIIKVEIPSKLEVPNVFTPNGDGSNDLFFLKVANMSEISALIFDRWGNKVFESTSSTGNIEWDGKNLSGKELPAGTFFYVIKATGKDGTEYEKKGNVSLYR
ncbi:MAG: gliding motility-associated C-terminal domain-containing protein [Bacteroidota bacterium]